MNKCVTQLVKLARSKGWTVRKTKGQHLAFTSPDGQTVFGPTTPSDYRSLRNLKARLKRAGLDI